MPNTDMSKTICSCLLCEKKSVVQYNFPDGWDGYVDAENVLCPDHAIVNEWRRANCGGCCGSWIDCDFWKSFAYRKWTFTEKDMRTIISGRCPKRVEGFVVKIGAFVEPRIYPDLLGDVQKKAGLVLAKAIIKYWNRFHPNDKKHYNLEGCANA